MITGEYEQLHDLIGNNVCAADQGRLAVAWHKDNGCYYIKCGVCGECKAMTRVLSLTEGYKAGEELPEPIKSNVEKSIRTRAEKLPQAPQAETFAGIPAQDLGTGELVPYEMLKRLAEYARSYGLDPARGHVCLMYGNPYFTIDGYLYHAQQSEPLYSLVSRPLTKDERADYQIEDGDHAWIGKVEFTTSGASMTGLGIVTREEMTAKSKNKPDKLAAPVVAKHPWQLAQKRCEWQALRRAFPIGKQKEEVDNGQGNG